VRRTLRCQLDVKDKLMCGLLTRCLQCAGVTSPAVVENFKVMNLYIYIYPTLHSVFVPTIRLYIPTVNVPYFFDVFFLEY